MSLPVVLKRQARLEFDEAVAWYERQQRGLGARFKDRVREVLARVSALPELHGIVYRDIRRAVVRQFPYCIYYRVRPTRVVVIGVIHGRRNPKDWQSRN